MNQPETRTALLAEIIANPWNAHGMTPDELAALRESIAEHGAWRPIIVVELDEADEYTPVIPDGVKYRIVDGYHLHKALSMDALEQDRADVADAEVMVIGLNSRVPVETQMEIGQTVNHGGRGSLEDPVKTGRIVEILTRRRPIEEVARRTGQSASFLETSRRVAEEGPRRVAEVVSAAPQKDRGGSHVPLVFEDASELREFHELIAEAERSVDPEKTLTAGRRRVATVLQALRAYTAGQL